MTVVLAGPLDRRHPYLCRIVAALRGLGYEVAVVELSSTDWGGTQADTILENTPAHEALIIDGSALSAFVPAADRLGARRAAVFMRETSPAGDLATILPHVGRVITTSDAARQRLGSEPACCAMDHIRVVEPGIEAGLPRSNGASDAKVCTLLAIDPVWPRPDHLLLLRALTRLSDLDWTLILAMRSADSSLMTQATEHGIGERLRFVDVTDTPMLNQAWREAGLCILATGNDGDGLAVSEALRRGVPVAVAGGPGITGRVPHKAGATAVPGDLVALSNAMRRIIFDAQLRREMSEAAWDFGHTLPSWDAQAHRFADMLGE